MFNVHYLERRVFALATKQQRTRNFATVVYPDSAPDNWLSALEDTHVTSCVSPLHDQDVNPDGESQLSGALSG